jgi:hypothetical protein
VLNKASRHEGVLGKWRYSSYFLTPSSLTDALIPMYMDGLLSSINLRMSFEVGQLGIGKEPLHWVARVNHDDFPNQR